MVWVAVRCIMALHQCAQYTTEALAWQGELDNCQRTAVAIVAEGLLPLVLLKLYSFCADEGREALRYVPHVSAADLRDAALCCAS